MLNKLLVALYLTHSLAFAQALPGVLDISNTDLASLDATMNGMQTVRADLGAVMDVMLTTTATAREVRELEAAMVNPNRCQDEASARAQYPVLPLLRKTPSKWRFSVEASFSAPAGKFTKEYLTANEPVLRGELDGLIARNFSSHDERVAAMTQLCAGKDEKQILQLGAMLGGKLGRIYDDSRANGAPDAAYVSAAAQWEALRTGGAAGVCRDSALTITQFLNACGISADKMKIESYRTIGGGHQVVTVRGTDGRPYTINWSELYTQTEDSAVANAPNPSLVNSDIFYAAYDPITGRLIEQRRTELGEVLRSVTGGRVRDPSYMPDLIRLEASNGVITASAFQTETQRGDFARGAGIWYNGTKRDDFLITAGVAFAHNERNVSMSPTRNSRLNQDMIYVGTDMLYKPVVPLYQRAGLSVAAIPRAGFSTEMYFSRNSLEGSSKSKNVNVMISAETGGSIRIQAGDKAEFELGGEAMWSVTRRPYNTERSDGKNPIVGVVPLGWSLHAGGKVRVGDVFVTGSGQVLTTRSDVMRSLSVGARDRNDRWRLMATVTRYDRQYGAQEDWVGIEGEQSWCFRKVGGAVGGSVSRSLSDPRNYAAMVSLTVRPTCSEK